MDRERRRVIGEFIVLAIYLVLEVYGLWNISHFWTLFFAALGVCALVFAEFPHNWFRIISALTIAICAIIYYVAPPILPDETETHGWLLPAREPTPPNVCDGASGVQGTPLTFIAGNIAFLTSKEGLSPVLTIDGHRLLSMIRNGNTVVFNADIYDDQANLVARIENNEFHLVIGDYGYQKRGDDRSKLTVFDKKGKEIFSINYANPKTILLTGVFYAPSGATVMIGKAVIMRTKDGGVFGIGGGTCEKNGEGGFEISGGRFIVH